MNVPVQTEVPYPIPLTCPVCGGFLHDRENELFCPACQAVYPQTLGIPDLRPPGTPDAEGDAEIVARLVAAYPTTDFAGLLDIRLRNAPTYNDLIGHEVGYTLAKADRGQEMLAMFRRRLETFFPDPPADTILDIGCGSGAGLVALARRHALVVGLDPSLPDLILARKALETEGLTNVLLVQAAGQRVPVAEATFDHASALNVLEHVFDLDGVLEEVRRVLRPGGTFAADSRNRYDLFLPEPHVRLRWVGFLPRRWAPAYVRWRRDVGYSATCLLSYGDLRRGLRKFFPGQYRIVFPGVAAYGGPPGVDAWLQRLESLPVLGTLALWFFPSHLVLAQKAA